MHADPPLTSCQCSFPVTPLLHASPVVHASPSSHELLTSTVLKQFPLPQQSVVHASPSSHVVSVTPHFPSSWHA